jgi:hypothetical protein
MGYLFVFLIAAAVGVAVYAITLRSDAPLTSAGSAPDPGTAAPPGDYVTVTGWRPDWQSRLTGLLGLLLAVILGAAAIAVSLYLGGSFVARLLDGAAKG